MSHRFGVLSPSEVGYAHPSDEEGSARSVGLHRDIADFEVIFNRYYPALCGFAFRYVESEAVAEELVQEVFLYIWRCRIAVSFPADQLHRYLYTAVRNAAMSHLRHRRVEERSAGDAARIHSPPTQPDSLVGTDELALAVRKAIANLPGRCREVLILHRDQGMTYRQIAKTLAISPKTVEVHMGRAFKLLRKALAPFRAELSSK